MSNIFYIVGPLHPTLILKWAKPVKRGVVRLAMGDLYHAAKRWKIELKVLNLCSPSHFLELPIGPD